MLALSGMGWGGGLGARARLLPWMWPWVPQGYRRLGSSGGNKAAAGRSAGDVASPRTAPAPRSEWVRGPAFVLASLRWDSRRPGPRVVVRLVCVERGVRVEAWSQCRHELTGSWGVHSARTFGVLRCSLWGSQRLQPAVVAPSTCPTPGHSILPLPAHSAGQGLPSAWGARSPLRRWSPRSPRQLLAGVAQRGHAAGPMIVQLL